MTEDQRYSMTVRYDFSFASQYSELVQSHSDTCIANRNRTSLAEPESKQPEPRFDLMLTKSNQRDLMSVLVGSLHKDAQDARNLRGIIKSSK